MRPHRPPKGLRWNETEAPGPLPRALSPGTPFGLLQMTKEVLTYWEFQLSIRGPAPHCQAPRAFEARKDGPIANYNPEDWNCPCRHSPGGVHTTALGCPGLVLASPFPGSAEQALRPRGPHGTSH